MSEPISSTVPAWISRTQAWCKLAVLIADELPAPRSIDFHDGNTMLWIRFTNTRAASAWAKHFGTHDLGEGGVTHTTDDWNGYGVYLTHPKTRVDTETTLEDLSRVRDIAERGEAEETARVEEDAAEATTYRREAEAEYDAERTGAVSE